MTKTVSSRLLFIGTVPVPASEDVVLTEQLLRERFNIHWIGLHVGSLFLGKTLKGAPARNLALHQLMERSTNQQIKDELGDEDISLLTYLLSLIEQQRNGEAGTLLTNEYANLIIVKVNGSVWVVRADWDFDCDDWLLDAVPFELPHEWYTGLQVISCE